MAEPLTADDILPLVAKLDPTERVRLFQMITAESRDATAYEVVPPGADEFSSDEDPLAWDAEGWEDIG